MFDKLSKIKVIFITVLIMLLAITTYSLILVSRSVEIDLKIYPKGKVLVEVDEDDVERIEKCATNNFACDLVKDYSEDIPE